MDCMLHTVYTNSTGSTRYEQKKKAEEEKKRIEAEKRAAKKLLLQQDQAELDKSLAAQKKQSKITVFDMQQQQQKSLMEQKKLAEQQDNEKKKIIPQIDISDEPNSVRNINQYSAALDAERKLQYGGTSNVIDASGNIDSVLNELNKKLADTAIDLSDRHPEKRLKAAFKQYQSIQWDIIRADHPGLRHSQISEILWQQWLKSPENPLNQAKADV